MGFDAQLQDVAEVLAVTVLLDQKERDVEMIEFCNAVTTINQRIRPGVILTRKTILNWYRSHKDKIAASLANDTDDSYKIGVLEKITTPVLRRKVIAAIFAICVCDYEFMDEETDFILTAMKIWKTDIPNSEEVDLIAG